MKTKLTIGILFLLGLLGALIFTIKQPLISSIEISQQIRNVEKSDSHTLKNHVRTLSSNERFTDEGLEKAVTYIVGSLRKDGISEDNIKLQEYNVGDRNYKNIIVRFKQDGFQKTLGKKYVIGAHYDSHDELPGADDNASGVAGVLEIARILNNQKIGHRYIELVFYSTEEMPHFRDGTMGSYFHAQANPDTELAIILEMIGYFSDEKGSQNFPIDSLKYMYSDIGNYITIISNFDNLGITRKIKGYFSSYLAKDKILSVDSMNAPQSLVPDITRSDHKSYWKFGIPAIMVTDTAYLRNKNYHTPDDTYEKLDYKKMKEVVDALVITVLSL